MYVCPDVSNSGGGDVPTSDVSKSAPSVLVVTLEGGWSGLLTNIAFKTLIEIVHDTLVLPNRDRENGECGHGRGYRIMGLFRFCRGEGFLPFLCGLPCLSLVSQVRPSVSGPPEWERNFFADQTFASSGEFTEAPTCQMKQIQCIPPLKCSL